MKAFIKIFILMRGAFLPKQRRNSELTSSIYDNQEYIGAENDRVNLHGDLCNIGSDLKNAIQSYNSQLSFQ